MIGLNQLQRYADEDVDANELDLKSVVPKKLEDDIIWLTDEPLPLPIQLPIDDRVKYEAEVLDEYWHGNDDDYKHADQPAKENSPEPPTTLTQEEILEQEQMKLTLSFGPYHPLTLRPQSLRFFVAPLSSGESTIERLGRILTQIETRSLANEQESHFAAHMSAQHDELVKHISDPCKLSKTEYDTMKVTIKCLLSMKSHRAHQRPTDAMLQLKYAADFVRLLATTSMAWTKELESWEVVEDLLNLVEISEASVSVQISLLCALEPFTHDGRTILQKWTKRQETSSLEQTNKVRSIYERLVVLCSKFEGHARILNVISPILERIALVNLAMKQGRDGELSAHALRSLQKARADTRTSLCVDTFRSLDGFKHGRYLEEAGSATSTTRDYTSRHDALLFYYTLLKDCDILRILRKSFLHSEDAVLSFLSSMAADWHGALFLAHSAASALDLVALLGESQNPACAVVGRNVAIAIRTVQLLDALWSNITDDAQQTTIYGSRTERLEQLVPDQAVLTEAWQQLIAETGFAKAAPHLFQLHIFTSTLQPPQHAHTAARLLSAAQNLVPIVASLSHTDKISSTETPVPQYAAELILFVLRHCQSTPFMLTFEQFVTSLRHVTSPASSSTTPSLGVPPPKIDSEVREELLDFVQPILHVPSFADVDKLMQFLIILLKDIYKDAHEHRYECVGRAFRVPRDLVTVLRLIREASAIDAHQAPKVERQRLAAVLCGMGVMELLVNLASTLVHMYLMDAQQGMQINNVESCVLTSALLPICRMIKFYTAESDNQTLPTEFEEKLLSTLVLIHGILSPMADQALDCPAYLCCTAVVATMRTLALGDMSRSGDLFSLDQTHVVAAAAATAEKRALIWTKESKKSRTPTDSLKDAFDGLKRRIDKYTGLRATCGAKLLRKLIQLVTVIPPAKPLMLAATLRLLADLLEGVTKNDDEKQYWNAVVLSEDNRVRDLVRKICICAHYRLVNAVDRLMLAIARLSGDSMRLVANACARAIVNRAIEPGYWKARDKESALINIPINQQPTIELRHSTRTLAALTHALTSISTCENRAKSAALLFSTGEYKQMFILLLSTANINVTNQAYEKTHQMNQLSIIELLTAAIRLPRLSSSLTNSFGQTLYASIGNKLNPWGTISRALEGLMHLAAIKPYYMHRIIEQCKDDDPVERLARRLVDIYEFLLICPKARLVLERLFHFVTTLSKYAAHMINTVASYGGRQTGTTLHLAHPFYELIAKFQNRDDYYQFDDVEDLCAKWSHLIMIIDQNMEAHADRGEPLKSAPPYLDLLMEQQELLRPFEARTQLVLADAYQRAQLEMVQLDLQAIQSKYECYEFNPALKLAMASGMCEHESTPEPEEITPELMTSELEQFKIEQAEKEKLDKEERKKNEEEAKEKRREKRKKRLEEREAQRKKKEEEKKKQARENASNNELTVEDADEGEIRDDDRERTVFDDEVGQPIPSTYDDGRDYRRSRDHRSSRSDRSKDRQQHHKPYDRSNRYEQKKMPYNNVQENGNVVQQSRARNQFDRYDQKMTSHRSATDDRRSRNDDHRDRHHQPDKRRAYDDNGDQTNLKAPPPKRSTQSRY